MPDLIVVGSGLTGLFAAVLAARRGAQVCVISQGRGGLSQAHGSIDVWAGGAPTRAIPQLRDSHPYASFGLHTVRHALDAFSQLMASLDYPFSGDLSTNITLPSPLGTPHITCLVPHSMAAGDLHAPAPITLLEIPAFRDAPLHLAAETLRKSGIDVRDVIPAPLPAYEPRRDVYSTEIARSFDDPEKRMEIARAWKPLLSQTRRVGIPAVLGLASSHQAHAALCDAWGIPVFEIPTLPPSLPGMRLEFHLRLLATRSGVSFVEGPRVIGRVDGRSGAHRVSGVVSLGAPAPHVYKADAVLLATGGFLHGGLVATQDGRVQESVFDLPLVYQPGREHWVVDAPFGSQPYAEFGVAVNGEMRPIGAGGEPIYENLFAAGGLLAGSDRAVEGSRQGISLASAYRAIQMALA
jgi:glycerol-3-phosphate dehydrogenase subunit B